MGLSLQWKSERGKVERFLLDRFKACFHILQYMGNALPRLVVKGLKCVCVCVRACVHVCVRAWVCACVVCTLHVYMHASFYVHCIPECLDLDIAELHSRVC